MQKIPGWGSYRPFPPRESRGFTYFTSGRWPLAFEPSETFVSSSELRHSPKRSLWKNFLHAEVTYILLKRSAYCPRSPLSSRVWKAGLKQQFQLAGTCTICTLYNYHVKKGRFKLRLNRWGGRGRVQLECTGMHLCQGRHILLHRGGTTDREPSETLLLLELRTTLKPQPSEGFVKAEVINSCEEDPSTAIGCPWIAVE